MTDDAAAPVPNLQEARRMAMDDALDRSFVNGRLNVEKRDSTSFFGVLVREAQFACLAAREFADGDGAFAGDERLRDKAVAALESVSQ